MSTFAYKAAPKLEIFNAKLKKGMKETLEQNAANGHAQRQGPAAPSCELNAGPLWRTVDSQILLNILSAWRPPEHHGTEQTEDQHECSQFT